MKKDDLTKREFNYYKLALNFVFFSLFLLMTTSLVLAHKVNIFAYVEGDTVYTESYFPDGTKVKGGTVEVYDHQGNKLLEGKTDEKGQFNFKSPQHDDLKIIILASLGHRNSYTLSAEELVGQIEGEKPKEQESEELKIKETTQVDLDQIKRIVDGSLDEKLRPLMRQLTKLQQKEISFAEIVGGIGYIFGLAGIIFYFMSRKRS